MEHPLPNRSLNILLADDDADERYFFEVAVKESDFATNFRAVNDGIYLMEYLRHHLKSLPDILFLDLNMPRKNGMECLDEIKSDEKLKGIPVVMYSSCGNDDNKCTYCQHGASSFLQKGKYSEVIQSIHKVLGYKGERTFTDTCTVAFPNYLRCRKQGSISLLPAQVLQVAVPPVIPAHADL